MNHRDTEDQKVVINNNNEQTQTQGFSFNPIDAQNDYEFDDNDEVKEEPFEVNDIKEESFKD